MKKLKQVNLIQFVPAIFILSFVVNNIVGYTAPNVTSKTASNTVQAADKTEKTTKSTNMGELDLSKIKDGTYEGEGTGFRGKIKVAVTVASHKITAIKVLSASDDAAYLNRASSGIIKSILAQQSLDVDVVSGATYSSKGIVAAVKNALTGEEDTSSAAGSGSTSAKAKSVGSTKESGTYKDGTFTGSANGYHGIVKVSVTIKKNQIKTIKILENHDDAAYFNRAKSTLVPLMLKKQTTNVDAVSGATYSSNGIIKAVRNALKKAEVKQSKNKEKVNTSTNNQSQNNTNQTSTSKPISGTYKDGTYEGKAEGFGGITTVSVTISKGIITEIKVIEEHDDDSYFNKAKTLLNQIINKQGTSGVDIVSGATYSSNGIINAVNNALKQALVTENENTNPSDGTTEENNGATTTATYTGTATCNPDEDEDFHSYQLSLVITVVDGKVTGIEQLSIEVESQYSWEKNLNLGYSRDAWSVIQPKLLVETSTSHIDVCSGATCSSNAIIKAYENAVAQIQ